ncbi:carbon-nitrogen hydrolase [Chytriomyces sp. MP71]|nr:carbon-nitrogen hydrolase [Chytriomyces sp. MP71]
MNGSRLFLGQLMFLRLNTVPHRQNTRRNIASLSRQRFRQQSTVARMKIAALQITTTPESVAANCAKVRALVAEVVRDHGAQTVVLPEYWATLGMKDVANTVAESDEQTGRRELQDFMSAMAREHGVTVVGGTIPMQSSPTSAKYRNSLLVFDREGRRIARYDKIHLFHFDGPPSFYENMTVDAGTQEPVTTEIGAGFCVRLSVCYDIRFPELYRHQGRHGYQVIVVPSAFTVETGTAHWETLLRARAIENQAYVVASAQVGVHPITGRITYGHSMIIDPWGRVVAEMDGKQEGFVVWDMDASVLDDVRRKLPALTHRNL